MIEITNLTKRKINKKALIGLAKKVLKSENKQEKNLSIVFVGKQRIRGLNKKYRDKDEVTDVLSFGEGLNEIIICPAVIKKEEVNKVLIHGILHVLGYKHSKKMQNKEELWQNHK